MKEFNFRGSDLTIRKIMETWSQDFETPLINGNEISYFSPEGQFNAQAIYLPSGMEFLFIEFDIKVNYFVELIASDQLGYILWVDIPEKRKKVEPINQLDFHSVPKAVLFHNKMELKLLRQGDSTGYSFLIYLHPKMLENLLCGGTWKNIFGWYFEYYIANFEFIKINNLELDIAENLYACMWDKAQILSKEKYVHQLLEMFFLKLEKKYNLVNSNHTVLFSEKEMINKIDELVAEQLKNGTVDKKAILSIAGLSKYQIDKLYKKMYNARFSEHHTNRKLAYAAELLKKGDVEVQEVGIRVGYADASSFIEAFKRKYNKTPFEIKKYAKSN